MRSLRNYIASHNQDFFLRKGVDFFEAQCEVYALVNEHKAKKNMLLLCQDFSSREAVDFFEAQCEVYALVNEHKI